MKLSGTAGGSAPAPGSIAAAPTMPPAWRAQWPRRPQRSAPHPSPTSKSAFYRNGEGAAACRIQHAKISTELVGVWRGPAGGRPPPVTHAVPPQGEVQDAEGAGAAELGQRAARGGGSILRQHPSSPLMRPT